MNTSQPSSSRPHASATHASAEKIVSRPANAHGSVSLAPRQLASHGATPRRNLLGRCPLELSDSSNGELAEFEGFSNSSDKASNTSGKPNECVFESFRAHSQFANEMLMELNKLQKTSMDLLLCLQQKNAPLNTHEEMCEWRANELMTPGAKLTDVHGCIGHKKIYKKLQIPCDMPEESWAKTTKMTLPHSNCM